jgi:zinc/manganese transport system permease protein
MFAHDFVRSAWLAGTGVALCCGIVGWFTVLRAQVFAGDALSHVAFVGAIAAALAGADVRLGLFALTALLALAMAGLGRRAHGADEEIGLLFAWILGLGVLLLALLARSPRGASGVAAVNTLFGSIYSLDPGTAVSTAAVGAGLSLLVLAALRPLLLASLDPELARARGLPVRLIAAGFLLALGVITADGTEAVGALLVLGLLAGPAGAAHRLGGGPRRSLAVSVALALASTWGGLALSYAVPSLPPSSAIIALAAGAYAAAEAWGRRGGGRRAAAPGY